MRSLARPEVIKTAAGAALLTALLCYPRLAQANAPHYPTWYLEALLFLGGMVLWAFVFAWHTEYSGLPVLTWRLPRLPLVLATVLGVGGGIVLRHYLDPALRQRTPEDYPVNVEQWLGMTLFSLAFTQLFLVFAPFAWLLRLLRRQELAMLLTVLFGVFVLALKNHSSPHPMAPELMTGLVLFRVASGFLSVFFFLRGGVVLVWWWGLLLQSRHLLGLGGWP